MLKVISQISMLSDCNESEILKHCKNLELMLIDSHPLFFKEIKTLQIQLINF